MDRTKEVHFEPAFDKRSPDRKTNYGVHGVNLRCVLKGEEGAVQFLLYTNWQLPSVDRELADGVRPLSLYRPMPADLGYHSPTPRFDGQATMGPCDYLDGRDCYYEGSPLNADRIFKVLVAEGDEGLWRELEDYYDAIFVRMAADDG